MFVHVVPGGNAQPCSGPNTASTYDIAVIIIVVIVVDDIIIVIHRKLPVELHTVLKSSCQLLVSLLLKSTTMPPLPGSSRPDMPMCGGFWEVRIRRVVIAPLR
jgi:hypothetical protein